MPDNLRSVIYAFDRSFEGAVAACGMPLVGEPSFVNSRNLLSEFYNLDADWTSQHHGLGALAPTIHSTAATPAYHPRSLYQL